MKIFVFCILSLFSAGVMATSDTMKIIGENDLVPVDATGSNIPLRFRGLLDAFGFVSSGCTATHLGRGYVITAGHCFWAGPEMMQDQSCLDTTIDWGFREGIAPYLKSQCRRIIAAQRTTGLDYAIIQVDPIPPVFIAPDLTRHAVIGDTVTVFSHPDEMPLRWSRLCGIERVPHPDVDSESLEHRCDTNPGSSGATLINVLTLKVVGIHDGGYDGDPSSAQEPMKSGMNYGTYLLKSPIYETLKSLGF